MAKKESNFHKWQALSLVLAVVLMWVNIGNHIFNMFVASVIVMVNALIEYMF